MENQVARQKAISALLIEDSKDDAELIVRELRRGEYVVQHEQVDTRESLLQALAKQRWDIIICDYTMPQFDGREALQLIRGAGIDTPFIYVSGTLGEDTAIEALKHGAQDYVMKGRLRRLVPAIERELREEGERREKAALEKHVHQLEKFEAIGRLAGGIAHDFTNVISAVSGWAQLGAEEAAPESGLRNRFQRIEREARRAADLTQKLLAFGRRQVLRPITLNLNHAILEMKDVLASGLGSSVEFKQVLAADLQLIQADPAQIGQVILNLCLNAKDALPDGGRLLIETQNVQIDSNFRKIHSYGRPGPFVLLTVSDNGTGMDGATLEKIFEPFFTTKEVGTGTGLGLSTVYGIVKQHNGFINVYSELGVGTTFRVYLPTSISLPEMRSEPSSQVSVKGTETVLLAEDDPALRQVTEEVLKGQGYTVLVAANGEEAVQLFEEHSDKIQLALLDVIMPLRSGLEVQRIIESRSTSVRVVLTTGYTAEAMAASPVSGDKAFLQKPYSPMALTRIVRATLDSPRRGDEAVE